MMIIVKAESEISARQARDCQSNRVAEVEELAFGGGAAAPTVNEGKSASPNFHRVDLSFPKFPRYSPTTR